MTKTMTNNSPTNITASPAVSTTTGLPGWSRFDDVFDSLFPVFEGVGQSKSRIRDVGDHFEWSIDMPGVGKDNIEVILEEDNSLTVKTSYDQNDDGEYERMHYKNTVRFGSKVDTDNIEANYEDGVLSVKLPKPNNDEDEGTRRIELD